MIERGWRMSVAVLATMLLLAACGGSDESKAPAVEQGGTPSASRDADAAAMAVIAKSASIAPMGKGLGSNVKAPGGGPLEIFSPEQMDRKAMADQPEGATHNIVYIVEHEWNNELFELHIFQDPRATVKDRPIDDLPASPKIDYSKFEWNVSATTDTAHQGQKELLFAYKQSGDVSFDLTGEVAAANNVVICRGEITNRDKYTWTRQTGLGWIGLWSRGAAEFHDALGERTFTMRTGSKAPVFINELMGHTDPNYLILLFEKYYQPGLWSLNTNKSRAVQIEAQPCNSIAGCRTPAISSIDTNIALNLPPGASAKFACGITFEENKQGK